MEYYLAVKMYEYMFTTRMNLEVTMLNKRKLDFIYKKCLELLNL